MDQKGGAELPFRRQNAGRKSAPDLQSRQIARDLTIEVAESIDSAQTDQQSGGQEEGTALRTRPTELLGKFMHRSHYSIGYQIRNPRRLPWHLKQIVQRARKRISFQRSPFP